MTDTSTSTAPAGPGDGSAPAAPAAPAAPTPAPPAPAAPAAPAPAPAAPAADDPALWPPSARTEIERLRREAGDSRINAKNTAREEGLQTAVRALAQAAGIELPDSGPVTLEAVQAQLAATSTERDAAKASVTDAIRDRDLVIAAWQAGVHPTKVDYLRYLANQSDTFRTLDPTAEDYGAKVASTIADITAKDQTLKVTGSTAASGAEGYGGAGGTEAITKEQFEQMPLDKRQELFFSDRPTYDRLSGRS